MKKNTRKHTTIQHYPNRTGLRAGQDVCLETVYDAIIASSFGNINAGFCKERGSHCELAVEMYEEATEYMKQAVSECS